MWRWRIGESRHDQLLGRVCAGVPGALAMAAARPSRQRWSTAGSWVLVSEGVIHDYLRLELGDAQAGS